VVDAFVAKERTLAEAMSSTVKPKTVLKVIAAAVEERKMRNPGHALRSRRHFSEMDVPKCRRVGLAREVQRENTSAVPPPVYGENKTRTHAQSGRNVPREAKTQQKLRCSRGRLFIVIE